MKINIQRNIKIENPETKTFLADAFFNDIHEKLPLVIFAHGYKGYKDWGAWDLMAMEFAKAGYYFVKFNFSHNGTTLENPAEFGDLDAFGNNNFSKEMSDYDTVISYFLDKPEIDAEKIAIMGHSRGGGISVIKAFEDERVKVLITLAGVSHFGYRFPTGERLEKWKNDGVVFSENGRTKQQMPHFFQFFEDYKENEERFNIQYAAQHLEKPYIIISAGQDEAVKPQEAELLHQWNKTSHLEYLENANHTFGASEPWEGRFMPNELDTATALIIDFLNKNMQ